jgi:hypothetical protein
MTRSWTDPTTNAVVLADLDATHFIAWHYGRGLTAMQQARTYTEFIHEYTHHWCFASLVFKALMILELRLQLFTGQNLKVGRFGPVTTR